MSLARVVLWVHALCGAIWVMTCASFVLAAVALHGDATEWRDFATRAAPRMNRLCLVFACIILLTGSGNLFFAARVRGAALPREFIGILAAKVTLFAAMALMLAASWRFEKVLLLRNQDQPAQGATPPGPLKIRMELCYGFTAVAGAIALGLGLWLSGT